MLATFPGRRCGWALRQIALNSFAMARIRRKILPIRLLFRGQLAD